jgi:exodeoxyribonuclease-5
MRQKEDNPIIDTSVLIREDIYNDKINTGNETKVNEIGEGIEYLNLNLPETRKGFSEKLKEYFVTDEFVKDSEYAKIIAWRNKTVSTMNSIIRKAIYGEISETSKILNGEKLIANNPVIQDDAVILNTNEEFTVESFSLNSEELSLIISENPDDDTMKVNLKYYDTIVSLVDDDGDLVKYNIEILHEDSEHEFQKVANILKLKAIQTKGRNKSWIRYYGFIRRYADVNFAYAISCHKSQGSTYNTTFVLDDDIDMNWNIVERNRIKYTAYTRASRKLYVLKRF